MVFDKINVNGQTFEAEGQFSLETPQVKITTLDGDVGQLFNQLESNDGKVENITVYKGDEERLNENGLKIDNVTVVGGNYRIELSTEQ